MTSRIGPLPAFDPEIAPIIDAWPSYADKESSLATMVDQRQLTVPVEAIERDGAFAMREITVATPAGRTVALSIITPTVGPIQGAIYWVHSGGMVSGAALGFDLPAILDIAQKHCLIIVAVEYGLGPERPAPGGLEDSFAGFQWTAASASELGYPEGVLFLHGLSGGGNIAAGTAFMARDAGIHYAGLVLDGPMLDDRTASISYQQNDAHPARLPDALRIMWGGVLDGADDSVIDDHPYVSPARLVDQDLSGFPAAFLMCGVNDPFRDETTAFAEAIWRSGGVADLHQWAGTIHGSDIMNPAAHVSRESASVREGWYDRLLERVRAANSRVSTAAGWDQTPFGSR